MGLRAGNISFSGTGGSDYKTSVGYGLDLSLFRLLGKTGDITYTGHTSPHTGIADLSMVVQSLTAEVRPLDTGETFYVAIGVGPGLYIFGLPSGSESRLGLSLGATLDYIARRTWHIGFASRIHLVANSPILSNVVSFMVRIGYSLKL